MLGKLLKYEFKALMNNLGVLYLVWLSLTLITAILPKASKYTSEFVENLLYTVWAISFIAAIIMTLVVVIDRRFYKNFYGVEGYFTLSLPVKISTHIWSKVIASTVWMVLTAFVGIFVMMIVGIATNEVDAYHQIRIFMNEQPAEARALIIFLLETLVLALAYISRFFLKTLTCINLSVQFSRFQSLLQGVFFIIFTIGEVYAAIVLIGHLCGNFVLNLTVNGNQIEIAQYGVGDLILMQVIECAIYFLASNYLMKNRLNLE